MKKVIRKLADVVPDPRNANKGTKRGRKALAASISKYGAGRSILVDRRGVIIAGNKTAESAAALKSKDIVLVETDGSKLVVVQRTDLDMAKHKKARELALADNRASELNLVWDEEVLAELAKGMDPDALWSESELRKIVGDVDGGAPEPKLDQAAELQKKWGTARGQIWEIGKHRMMCGDSTDAKNVELLMGGGQGGDVLHRPALECCDWRRRESSPSAA